MLGDTQMPSSDEAPDDPKDKTFHPRGNTPPKCAKRSVTISPAQRQKTDELDGGRCFVTRYRSPSISIISAHILASETDPHVLRELEMKWGFRANELNVNTSRNIIRLRCDWHTMFDNSHWAIVPVKSQLAEIYSRYLKAVENQRVVSPTLPDMLDKAENYDYYIVFFSPLAEHVYHRAINDDQTEFQQMVVPDTGISPLLKHHSHPYFAIQNAVPKFDKHRKTLTKEQKKIHQQLKNVVEAWNSYFADVAPERSRGLKRGGPSGDGTDPSERDSMGSSSTNGDDSPSFSHSKRPRIAKDPVEDSGRDGQSSIHAMEGANDPGDTSQLQNLPPTPSISLPRDASAKKAHDSYWDYVVPWLDSVAECDPVMEQVVEWPVGEASRPVPRSKPMVLYEWSASPDKSKFSSTDWAMYIMGSALERSLSPPRYFD